jgi:hypothetical protein
MNNDFCRPNRLRGLRISAAVLGCGPVFIFAALAQVPATPTADNTVTVYGNQTDPCPIPKVLAEGKFAITCQTSTVELLERLRRPDACGKESRHRVGDACAVLMYVIDDYSSAKEYGLLPTWTVRIGKMSHPDNIAETVVTVLRNNSSEERFGPDRVYELLLPIRLNNKVTEYEVSGTGTRFDRPVNLLEKQIRYHPALLIGRGRAREIMTREDIKNHFETPPQIVQDLEKLLNPRCQISKIDC